MEKQIKFELTGISTARRKNKSGVKETIKVYKYVDHHKDASLVVKGTFAATELGLPTGDIGDKVLMEIGAKNTQQKFDDALDVHGLNKTLNTKKETMITAKDRKLLRDHQPTAGELKNAPRIPGKSGRPRKH